MLLDHGTASSDEIVATALEDAGRARIVGETTLGSGTILGQFSLEDGSALRIGTLEWLTATAGASGTSASRPTTSLPCRRACSRSVRQT